ERARLRELALDGLEQLLARQQAPGTSEQAVHTALRLLAIDPLRESVHRALMRLYAAQGRRSAALQQYEACAALLRRELGTEPEPETGRLYRELLQLGSPPIPAGREETWLGLALRDLERHEAPLIGREPEMGRLRKALADSQAGSGALVAILGEA